MASACLPSPPSLSAHGGRQESASPSSALLTKKAKYSARPKKETKHGANTATHPDSPRSSSNNKSLTSLASMHAGKPRKAKSAMKLLTTRNITKATVAFCLMARTLRKHQTGYDLQIPNRANMTALNPWKTYSAQQNPSRNKSTPTKQIRSQH